MACKRKYRLAKITDPASNGHSVRLRSGQPFVLVLSEVTKNWVVNINSPFLIIEKIEYDFVKNKVLYFMGQKYGLRKFDQISNFFLGNISFYSDKDRTVQCCVYLDCTNKSKQSVLTVINPRNAFVKFDANQLVHVVLYSKPFVHWEEFYNNDFLELIRQETVLNDLEGYYATEDAFCSEPCHVQLPVNDRLIKEIKSEVEKDNKAPEKIIEHHYWFRIKRERLALASASPNGCFGYGRLTFEPVGNNQSVSPINCNLCVNLRGTAREKIDMVLHEAMTYRAENWAHKFVDMGRSYIFMPAKLENIDLKPGQDVFYVELPQPSIYYSEYADNSTWKRDSDPDYPTSVKVSELEERTIGGKIVQRFLITNLMDEKNIHPQEKSKESPLITTIKFSCGKSIGEGNFSYKVLNVSFWKKGKTTVTSVVPNKDHNTSNTATTTRPPFHPAYRSYDNHKPRYSSAPPKKEEEKLINEIEMDRNPEMSFSSFNRTVKLSQIGQLKKSISANAYEDDDYGYNSNVNQTTFSTPNTTSSLEDSTEVQDYWERMNKKKTSRV